MNWSLYSLCWSFSFVAQVLGQLLEDAELLELEDGLQVSVFQSQVHKRETSTQEKL